MGLHWARKPSCLPLPPQNIADRERKFTLIPLPLATLSGWPRPGCGAVEIRWGATKGRRIGWKLVTEKKGDNVS